MWLEGDFHLVIITLLSVAARRSASRVASQLAFLALGLTFTIEAAEYERILASISPNNYIFLRRQPGRRKKFRKI